MTEESRKYDHDIIPPDIWFSDPETFKKYLHELQLEYWLCKQVFFDYYNWHGLTATDEDLRLTCGYPGLIYGSFE